MLSWWMMKGSAENFSSFLEKRRAQEAEKHKQNVHVIVKKHDVFKELLENYKDGGFEKRRLSVSFDEDGSGGGVLRG